MVTDMFGIPINKHDKVFVRVPSIDKFTRFVPATVMNITGQLVLVQHITGNQQNEHRNNLLRDVAELTLTKGSIEVGSYGIACTSYLKDMVKVVAVKHPNYSVVVRPVFQRDQPEVSVPIEAIHCADPYMEYLTENYPELMI